MSTSRCVIAVDVGNSAIKVAAQTGEQGNPVFHRLRIGDGDWAKEAVDWARKFAECRDIAWRVASVRSDAAAKFIGTIHDLDSRWSVQSIDRHDVPIKADVDFPDRLGIDRLLSAFAARNRWHSPLIVIDAGSAITVDCVCDAGNFVGGAILAGLNLQANALASGTDALPHVDWSKRSKPLQIPGRFTEAAIELGVLLGTVGAIDRLIDTYCKQPHLSLQNAQIVLTGGDAEILSSNLAHKHHLSTNLVCLGLLDLDASEKQNVDKTALID